MSSEKPLKFIVAPHIVQDLGLNLYTSLPRVLVEFVANAYDADAPHARISFDSDKVERARRAVQEQWELEKEHATRSASRNVTRLAERALPDDVEIIIEDAGHGMSREDFRTKFLVAGRRRREMESKDGLSPGRRALMGRKGLGKLAGFGVAQVITVVSRAKGEKSATKIVLDYNDLIKVRDTNEIPIREERLEDGGGFANSGTRVILSRLLYEPMKSRPATIEHELGDHFAQIDPNDFRIELNDQLVGPTPRRHVYAWPEPDRPVGDVVEASYQTEDGRTFVFQYRLRFTEDRAALAAKDRGVRVYAHKRLTASPSLLAADTNMHGFRMTDYLDGVVYADFIDDQPEDYIATDRQALRWESPLLAPMYEMLSQQIKEACKNRQRVRDEEKEREVEEDEFTKGEIEQAELTKKEKKAAYRMAAAISSLHKKGVEDPGYQAQFSQVVRALGQGEILAALAELARQDRPELDRVVAQVARLTAEELEGFFRYVKGRLNGIAALKKIVKNVDFKTKQNEKTIQKMFEESPWLIDPTYTQFLTADTGLSNLFDRLAKVLRIGKYAPEKRPDRRKRPDLVFLLGNDKLGRLVIVELKSANIYLENEHLEQLEYYMARSERWLKTQLRGNIKVLGHLIGTIPSDDAMARGQVVLQDKVAKRGPETPWTVRDYLGVLEETEAAHYDLLQVGSRIAKRPAGEAQQLALGLNS